MKHVDIDCQTTPCHVCYSSSLQGIEAEELNASDEDGQEDGHDNPAGSKPQNSGRKPPKGPKQLKLPDLEKYERPSLVAKRYCDLLSTRVDALGKLGAKYEQGIKDEGTTQVDKKLYEKNLGCTNNMDCKCTSFYFIVQTMC